ncbi:MAG TPA: TlpA disulfide reductase family protein [Alphaproteobacteria bacterium]|nr:TlpA family protein disulfide reductase [Rhodospirillaceae bacterium]HRJ12161.1 TlpA disulfide reductase family protein [Alphaproteobacteria bacterium]
MVDNVMHYPYRILWIFPRIFCLLLLLAAPVQAERVQILSQFHAYKSPRQIPNLSFEDMKGTRKQLSDYRGKWVLINIWATWCAPCRKELPQLDNLQEAFADTNFIILPISIDSPQTAAKILTFYHERDLKNLPILIDRTAAVMKIMRPSGLPVSWLVSPSGMAVGEVTGYASWDSDSAANLIEYYLQQTP